MGGRLRRQTLKTEIWIGFVAHGLEHSAELPADASHPQRSGIVMILSPVMTFDVMPTDASVLGAQVATALGHHPSDFECKDCGVEWILECTGALPREKMASLGHLILNSNCGLRTTELP